MRNETAQEHIEDYLSDRISASKLLTLVTPMDFIGSVANTIDDLRSELARVKEENARMDEALKLARHRLKEWVAYNQERGRCDQTRLAIAVIDEARRETGTP